MDPFRRHRIVFCLILLPALAGAASAAEEVWLATWNVEMLFDDVADGRHDRELMEWWTTDLYHYKLQRLASVISRMKDGRGPDILALVEVENRKVVEDLVARLPDPDDYHIVHIEGQAGRSIEVALISRLPVVKSSSHFVMHGLRDVLRVDLQKNGHSLTVLVNHWKSRFGGTVQTADVRNICASRAYQLYYEIAREDPDADVVICGDFNDDLDNNSVREILHARGAKLKIERQTSRRWLYNCTTELRGPESGTYYYDYNWEFLDQVVVSRDLLDTADDGGGFRYRSESLRIFNPDEMLLNPQGGRPWSFGGEQTQRAQRGYSDHLPLLGILEVAEQE